MPPEVRTRWLWLGVAAIAVLPLLIPAPSILYASYLFPLKRIARVVEAGTSCDRARREMVAYRDRRPAWSAVRFAEVPVGAPAPTLHVSPERPGPLLHLSEASAFGEGWVEAQCDGAGRVAWTRFSDDEFGPVRIATSRLTSR